MTDELWDRIRRLEGRTLDTATGKPFKVMAVTDRSVTVKPLQGKGTYPISRAKFDEVLALGLSPDDMTAAWLFEKGIALPVYKIAILKEILSDGPVPAVTPADTSPSMPPLTPEQMDAVLSFLPSLERPEADFGQWEGGNKQVDGTIVMPYYSPSELTMGLVRALYEQGVVVDFDWPEWQPEAERLYEEPECLESADLDTLRKLLTLHVRKDRFCEGHLGTMLEEGHITAILRRLKQVRDEMVGGAAGGNVPVTEHKPVLDIPALLSALAKRRPVFHSEADFQHAFAWEIQTQHPDADVRLEYRPPAFTERAYVAIWVRLGDWHVAIELKYKTRARQFVINGEWFDLLDQSAQDVGRYDFLKDIERLQRVVERHTDTIGHAVLLTNDRGYWSPPRTATTADAAFRLFEGREVAGNLCWGPTTSAGTMKGREAALGFRTTAPLCWQNYSELGPEGVAERFRYLAVVVQPEG